MNLYYLSLGPPGPPGVMVSVQTSYQVPSSSRSWRKRGGRKRETLGARLASETVFLLCSLASRDCKYWKMMLYKCSG